MSAHDGAKAQTTGRWSSKASAGSGSARGAGTRHPPEQGGPGEAAHTAAAVAARAREREKVNADAHAPRDRKTDGGEPQTLLGRLQRVVLPVKRDRSPDNPKLPATTLPACLIAPGLALAQYTKVYPVAAGLALNARSGSAQR